LLFSEIVLSLISSCFLYRSPHVPTKDNEYLLCSECGKTEGVLRNIKEKYVRWYCSSCKYKYLNDPNDDEIKLSNTKVWGNRTLDCASKEWRDLRQQMLKKYDYTCRFCGYKFKKFMVLDHKDGDASNNN
jgi:ribosomal protein L37AE/L43A